MNATHLLIKPLQIAVAISWIMLGFTPVQAQPTAPPIPNQPPNPNPLEELIFLNPPPDQDAPEGTEASGDRNPCPEVLKPLTALVPVRVTQQDEQKLVSLQVETTQAHPTFWFYIPYQPEAIVSSTFLIQDRQGRTIYETEDNFVITDAPGIIRITLPPTEPPLNKDEWYEWGLGVKVSCDATLPPQRDSTEGWVKREDINSQLQTQLQNATPRKRAILYARNGFLFDALTALADMENKDLMQEDWSQLLRSVGSEELDAIATEPIVDCCNVEAEEEVSQ